MKILKKLLHLNRFINTLIITIGIILLFVGVKIVYTLYTNTNKIDAKPWLSYEGSACSFNGCWTSEMNQKYNYWRDQAVKQRNPDLCNNVEGIDHGDYFTSKKIAVSTCKAEYGGIIGDINYCINLKDANDQKICLNMLAEKAENINTCEKLPNPHKYKCYSMIAKKTKNLSICQKIPEKVVGYHYERKVCIINLGKVLNDTSVCNLMNDKELVNECIEGIKNLQRHKRF
ncbi:MAG: hypothetical protein KatS3mg090_0111 [Patescibacteria group bacterium]|nr:MAG: hypothetical protein KatS3mg090_0111 [Patescibacteria group bacterium]